MGNNIQCPAVDLVVPIGWRKTDTSSTLSHYGEGASGIPRREGATRYLSAWAFRQKGEVYWLQRFDSEYLQDFMLQIR